MEYYLNNLIFPLSQTLKDKQIKTIYVIYTPQMMI